MIYFDDYTEETGHLISDSSLKELHQFANKLGLKRWWFQNNFWPHYDLSTARAKSRVEVLGGKRVTCKELVKIQKSTKWIKKYQENFIKMRNQKRFTKVGEENG